MSGETETDISAWTVDSLRAHLLGVIAEKDVRMSDQDRRYEQRFESQEKALRLALIEREKAVEAAFHAQEAALQTAITEIRCFYDAMLTEREQRYQQRFEASEKAVVLALANINREFEERVRQVRSETATALEAADKAIAKAETANEKRFESVNEFRAQQADIIQTFSRKAEVDAQLKGLAEKITDTQVATTQLAATAMPRNEYDRAHVDLADKVTALDKAIGEKLDAQTKAIEGRIALLQSQVSNIEAITR